MRQPQSLKCGFAHELAHAQDHQQAQEQAERGRGLDPRGVGTALAVRRVLGHVGGGTAVLAAERQALQHAQRDQDHRRRDADGRVAGQQADDEGRQAHDQNRHQEGVLAPDHVAQAAEHDGAERTHQEAGSKRQQREDEPGARSRPLKNCLAMIAASEP
jgi:hypothetical protein